MNTRPDLQNKHQRQPKALMLIVIKLFSVLLLATGVLLGIGFIRERVSIDNTLKQLDRKGILSSGSKTIPNSIYPASINIPALKISAGIVPLGLAPDNTLQVPADETKAGWYANGTVPGETGPAIIIGHLDSTNGPALFYRLKDLQVGDKVEIMRSDGSQVQFTVETKEEYSQDNFPSQKVYGDINYPGLRLITCSGKYIKRAGHYSNNLVVYARLENLIRKNFKQRIKLTAPGLFFKS